MIAPYTEALEEAESEAPVLPILACNRCGAEMDAGSWMAMKEWCLSCWRLFFGLSWRRIPEEATDEAWKRVWRPAE